jgi:rod shape determining protein RodA
MATTLKENYIAIRKQPLELFDMSLFMPVILLFGIGLISIYSATYESHMSDSFFKQLIFGGIGIGTMIVFMFLPERFLQSNSIVLYAISILFLILVLFFGKGISGTKGWFQLGGLSFQPSELAKFTALLAVARYLSLKGTDIKTLRDLGITLGIIFLPVGLIVLQPDIGTATVFIAIALGVLLWAGFDLFVLYMIVSLPIIAVLSLLGTTYFVVSVSIFAIIGAAFRRKILITAIALGVVIAVGYFSPVIIENLMPHQQNRIEAFLNPGSDPRGKGYNVIQSIMAVGSGGFTGKGFLQGTQTQLRYIPEQWTDFIFCVPTEEFGFIGGALVILLIASIIYRSIKIATLTNSAYFSLLCTGIASIFLYHMIINIGMALGLMPVMGIPLPFLSYGGSSLIVNFAFIGLMLNAYRSYKQKERAN